jgi:hypothetical protein
MTDWTLFTETKVPLVPAEVKCAKTTNGAQMIGIKHLIHLDKAGKVSTCGL